MKEPRRFLFCYNRHHVIWMGCRATSSICKPDRINWRWKPRLLTADRRSGTGLIGTVAWPANSASTGGQIDSQTCRASCSAVDPRRRVSARPSGEHVDASEPRNPRAAETCRRGWAGSKDKTTKVPGLLLVHTSQAIRPRVSMPQVLARFQAGDFKRVSSRCTP